MTHVVATLTDKGLSLVIDGDPVTINDSHKNYDEILDALRNKEHDLIPDLVNIGKRITELSEGLIKVVHGVVYYGDHALHNAVTERLIQTIKLGLDARPLARFLNRLMNNPSHHSVSQLYSFMEACDLPITEDGRLLAYKSVNRDYWDTHTGKTFHNTIGAIIEMPRNMVDDNPERTCSNGLHVCSQKYGMYGKLLLLVAVDPADVVSVPNDYNQAKMRVCRYEVLKDVDHEGFRSFEDEPIYSDEDIDWDFDDEEDIETVSDDDEPLFYF